MKQFNKALLEIIFNSGGVGHITFNDYVRLIPQPSWNFWDAVPDEKDEYID
jgi:hypothetical protein